VATLPILIVPDRRLKQPSLPVATVDGGVRRLMDDMLETMREAPGIGLSAIQINVPKRIIVVEAADSDDQHDHSRRPLFLVNPEITWTSDEMVILEEGCLSLPDQYADIERPAEVTVTFLDRDGAPQERKSSGVLARCIQHEMDHLDGVLLVDRLSPVRRGMILRKLSKARKQQSARA
jgi:peptide deformylase